MRLLTLAEYTALERPGLEWLIQGIIPKPGLVTLLGEPKAGKSFLALQMGLALSQGRAFEGHRVSPDTHRILYLQFDTSELIWRDRLRSMLQADISLDGPLLMVHPEDNKIPMHILDHECLRWMREAKERAQPDLVILDVLREVHDADENDSQQMKQVGDAIMSLFGDCSILVLHHTHKIPEDFTPSNIINLSRGSSYLAGKSDNVLLIHNGFLHMAPRFAERCRYRAVRMPTGLFHLPDTAELVRLEDAMLAFCAEFPEQTHNQLAPLACQRLKVSRATWYRHLDGLPCVHAVAHTHLDAESATPSPSPE